MVFLSLLLLHLSSAVSVGGGGGGGTFEEEEEPRTSPISQSNGERGDDVRRSRLSSSSLEVAEGEEDCFFIVVDIGVAIIVG